MKIVTWNVNSLKARADFVALYLDAEAPDVLCVQELKLEADAVPRDLFAERGYHLAIHGQPQWNGVLIASKQPLEQVESGLPAGDEGEARMISARTAGIRFVNLYCPQGQRTDSPKFPYKLGFYDALIDWVGANVAPGEPAVVCGDLNIAPEPRDIWDPEGHRDVPSFHPEEHARWAKLLALGLHDVVGPRVPPNTYSFWDYRAGMFHKKQGMRIDHLLLTEPLVPRVERAWIDRSWRKKQQDLKPSDHAPVGVVLGA